ncbi:hypothetical protein Moror_9672 [Moniliophthora roreri MCA 2997]|uniref:Ubiquitin 3 binding protein But2 C-terminal domain-containing protein n=1 Tax=Moniliophthora roreri (strain MCA 2997) TaxID=1381753 RepID=V2WIN3_MONRO|nr:hypothetical protein Moror_9672 [Moniliophthora roreri MCA 2997]KAI3600695.1 hypothetical protein WG66_014207 [Moniliophthora roreri]
MFTGRKVYDALPQSPDQERPPTEGPWRNALLALATFLTAINLALVCQFLASNRTHVASSYDIANLEYRSTYIGLDSLYDNTKSNHTHSPVINRPRYIASVYSNGSQYVIPEDHDYYLTPDGYMPLEVQRIVVNQEVTTIAQFRIMDWGMENCRLTIDIPAFNETKKAASIYSDHGSEPVVLDVWFLDSVPPAYFGKPGQKIWPPKRQHLLASLSLSYGLRARTPTFPCPSASDQNFEVVCSPYNQHCNADLMYLGWTDNIFYIEQQQSF